jgi:hypothetical protein
MQRTTNLFAFQRQFRWSMAVILVLWLVFDSCAAFSQENPFQGLEKPRTWRDASGVFRVIGGIVEISTTHLTLRAPDGELLKVDRSQLSPLDQAWLRDYEQSKSPFASQSRSGNPIRDRATPARMETDRYSLEEPRASWPAKTETPTVSVTVHPTPILLSPTTELKEIPVGLAGSSNSKFGEVILNYPKQRLAEGGLYIVEPESGRVILSLVGNSQGDESRLLVGNLPNGPFVEALLSPTVVQVRDHDIETGLTLVSSRLSNHSVENELVIYAGLLDGKPSAKYRLFVPKVKDGKHSEIVQAYLIDENKVLLNLQDGIHLYQFEPAQSIFTATINNHYPERKVCLSPNKKLLAVAQPSGFSLMETKTGKDLGFVDLNRPFGGALSFDRSSSRICFAGENFWGWYDLRTRKLAGPEVISDYQNKASPEWISPDFLLLGNGTVMSIDLGVPIYRYYSNIPHRTWQPVGALTTVHSFEGIKIRTLPLPHPACQAAMDSVKKLRKEFSATGPGTAVQISLDFGRPPRNR